MSSPLPTNVAERDDTSLEQHISRITCGVADFTANDDFTGSAALWGPDLVDVVDGTSKVGGSIHLDLGLVTGGRFEEGDTPSTLEDAIRTAVTLAVAHQLHEIAEWLAVDDVAVFDTHCDHTHEWNVIVEAARAAATIICDKHPRCGTNDSRKVANLIDRT